MKSFIKKCIILFLFQQILSGCSFIKSEFNSNITFNPQNIIHLNIHQLTASKTGNPKSYVVYGKKYSILESSKGYLDTGFASLYSDEFNLGKTSSGDTYNLNKLSAASRVLPLPCYVNIFNHKTGLSVNVLVNDRGPFSSSDIVRISPAVAYKLGIKQNTISDAKITIKAIKPYTSIMRQKHFYLQLAIFSSKKEANKVNTHLKSIFNVNNSTVVKLTTKKE